MLSAADRKQKTEVMEAVGFADRAMCFEECDQGAKRNETM